MMNYRVVRGDETPRGPLSIILDEHGRSLGVDDLAVLAQQPQDSTTHRWVEFVVTDESRPKHGKPFLRPQCLRFVEVPSITFLDTGLSIGTIDKLVIYPAGNIPDTEGFAAVATALIADTALGGLAWEAMKHGSLNGFCLQGDGLPDSTGEIPSYLAKNIMFCHIDGACIANSRVLALAETPREHGSRS